MDLANRRGERYRPWTPPRHLRRRLRRPTRTSRSPAGATTTRSDEPHADGHVNINAGAGFVNAPDGTVITFSLTNAGGATAAFVGPGTCTTAGTRLVHGRDQLARDRHDDDPGGDRRDGQRRRAPPRDGRGGHNSAPATKPWADDTVRTDIHNALRSVVTTVQAGTTCTTSARAARRPDAGGRAEPDRERSSSTATRR